MAESSTQDFYARLRVLDRFIEITEPSNYLPIPANWQVIITDIRGSTQAIEQGRYKEVNLVASCSIVALLNLSSIEIPFVFGGDGASILIPPSLLDRAKQALLATQTLARNQFGFDLRVGIVPVAAVLADQVQLKVAKLKISPNYTQAVFIGGGLQHAERLIKSPQTADQYRLDSSGLPAAADYSGLECRWQDIPSKDGEIICLLAQVVSPDAEIGSLVYRQILLEIEQIYGNSSRRRPVNPDTLTLAFRNRALRLETKVHKGDLSLLHQVFYLQWIRLVNVVGSVLMRCKIRVGEMEWGSYKTIVSDATDYEKFDDVLRMVITGNADQRKQLILYLDLLYQKGIVVYGMHVTDRALMTCLVFERNGRQVHFVDGADGGYAVAAKAMKARMQNLAINL